MHRGICLWIYVITEQQYNNIYKTNTIAVIDLRSKNKQFYGLCVFSANIIANSLKMKKLTTRVEEEKNEFVSILASQQ